MAGKTKGTEAGTPVPTSQPVAIPPNVCPSTSLENVELQNLNARFACYIDRVRYLETENARLTNLQEQTSTEKINLQLMLDDGRALTSEYESEISRLREEMAQQLEKYQNLMDIWTAYDKLLCGEEQRLNITPSTSVAASHLSQSFSRSVRGTPSPRRSAAKRNRNIYEEAEETSCNYAVASSSTGDIEIIEADRQGKFVKLHNKGEKEVVIGGWRLIRKSGANETVHKFRRSVTVDGGAELVIWSSDSGVSSSPGNIVMKAQKWFVSEEMKTTLLNLENKEEATTERIRRQITTRSSRSLDVSGSEEVHDQNAQSENNCSIM